MKNSPQWSGNFLCTTIGNSHYIAFSSKGATLDHIFFWKINFSSFLQYKVALKEYPTFRYRKMKYSAVNWIFTYAFSALPNLACVKYCLICCLLESEIIIVTCFGMNCKRLIAFRREFYMWRWDALRWGEMR